MSLESNKGTEIIGEIEKMIMEEKIHILENTLSDTISFFSMVLALGAIIAAILIGLFSWWLNNNFNKKINKLVESETKVSNDLLAVQKIKKETDQQVVEVTEMYQSINSSKKQIDLITNNQKAIKAKIDFLQEEIKLERYKQDFRYLIYEIEKKVDAITQEELARFYIDELEGSPEEQFKFTKKYYDDAKKNFEELIEDEYEIGEFLLAQEDDVISLSDSILSEYDDAKGFLEELNNIKK